MGSIVYNRHSMNAATILLTGVFFALPALVLGLPSLLFLAALVLLGSGVLGASKVDPERIPGVHHLSPYYNGPLYAIVADLSARARLDRVPDVYISEQPSANAAAVETEEGPAIIVSNQLISSLTRPELEAVLAHEISHIKHGDIRLLTLLAHFRSVYTAVPRMILALLIFAPLLLFFIPITQSLLALGVTAVLAVLVERTIMRLREYGADYSAAQLIADPMSLTSALHKLESAPVYVNWFGRQVAVPRSRISESRGISGLFKSHPPTTSRISFLTQMARKLRGFRQGYRIISHR